MRKLIIISTLLLMVSGCKSEIKIESETTEASEVQEKTIKQIKEELASNGFKIFDYVDEKTKDTVIMQQYFIAFLKRGPERSQSKEKTDSLQTIHLAHLQKMYDMGYADISGPFGDD